MTKKAPVKKAPAKKKEPPKRRGHKLSDAQFWAILRDNLGLFAMTSKAIEKKFGISYTRQAVRARAMQNPELLAEIEEENIDVAEGSLHQLMRSGSENVRLKAIETFLKAKGTHRGYYEKQKQTHEGDVSVTVRFVDGGDNS